MSLDELEFELRKLDGVQSAGFDRRDDVLLVQIHTRSTPVDPELALQALQIAYRHSEKPVAVEVVRWRTPKSAADGEESRADGPPVADVGETDVDETDVDETDVGERRANRGADASEPPAKAAAVIDLVNETAADDVDTDGQPDTAQESRRASRHDSREKRVRLLAVLTFPDTDEVEVHLTLDGQRSIGRGTTSRDAAGAVLATLDAVQHFTPTLEYRIGWVKPLEGEGDSEHPVYAVQLDGDGASPSLYGLSRGAGAYEAASRATLQALNRTLALELWAAS